MARPEIPISFHNPLTGLLKSLARDLRGAYRPELHYMRGPGPKWREKYSQMHTASPSQSEFPDLNSTLRSKPAA